MPGALNEKFIKDLVDVSLNEISPENAVAMMIYGPFASGYADEKVAIDILVITSSENFVLSSSSRLIGPHRTRILMSGRKIFEMDVESGWLGGLLAENLLTPYQPLLNQDYLWNQEVKAKKRIIDEILNNLILGFPEMSKLFMLKPEYFMFEAMARRAALFPLLTYRFLNVLRGDLRERNCSLVMRGFEAAIKELSDEGKIYWADGFLKISEEYINSLRNKGALNLISIFRKIRINIIRYVLRILPSIMEGLLDDYKIYRSRSHVLREKNFGPKIGGLEDPKRYIFIPTASGVLPFNEKITVNKFLEENMPKEYALKRSIKRLGGVLNNAYKLRIVHDGKENNLVVKVFNDWYGWKWFPLALWALGTRGFAVLGRARLEREYAINMYLSSHGINVPKIIYISPGEKLIFQEYIEGRSASEIIRQVCKVKSGDERDRLLGIIRRIGGEIARIHAFGISLGDCKPENIILSSDGRIFFVDLEQAGKNGDQAWDIAEFLYYSGHDFIFSSPKIVEMVAREFISGYLEAHGKIENVRKAASLKYVKVFSFFTPPHILFVISSVCRKIVKEYVVKEMG
ncbi:MAG: lipopolysaccharide kinase InaA family protein [Candidatus Bathyarchaeia archaeon]